MIDEISSHVRGGVKGQNQSLDLSSFGNDKSKEKSRGREYTRTGCQEREQANVPQISQMEAEQLRAGGREGGHTLLTGDRKDQTKLK